MEQELWLPTVSHFCNDNGWSGSSGILSYEIEAPVEGQVTVVLWYGPFSRPCAEETDRQQFAMDEAGLEDLRAWLTARAAEMNAAPARTPAQTRAWYDQVLARQREA